MDDLSLYNYIREHYIGLNIQNWKYLTSNFKHVKWSAMKSAKQIIRKGQNMEISKEQSVINESQIVKEQLTSKSLKYSL